MVSREELQRAIQQAFGVATAARVVVEPLGRELSLGLSILRAWRDYGIERRQCPCCDQPWPVPPPAPR